MLSVETGPFHPLLEKAFKARILELKKDPLAPLLVVGPSGTLLERLQRVLGGSGQAFMNIEFQTFSSLSERVVEGEGTPAKPVLSDPLFFDTLVKQIIKKDRPFPTFTDVAVPEGFPVAVRATLRDLIDSGASADIVEAVGERFLGKDVDVGSLRYLLRLYWLYLKRIDELPVVPRSTVLKSAIQLAPTSAFLKRFQEVLFYGFYDATGLQTDFFHAVVKNHPSRLFFPYDSNKSTYAFAKRFRDTHLQPVMHEEIKLVASAEGGAQVSVFNVSGLRDEADIIAQKLRQAHDEDGIPFSEMAVVARSRERLQNNLPRALNELLIPHFSTNESHLKDWPVYRTVINELEEKMVTPDWPASASWKSHGEKAGEVLRASPHGELFAEPFKQMDVFELLSKKVSKEEYFDVLKERLGRHVLPRTNESRNGVALLHAEAARGLSFKVLILAGIEEKTFPRIIREDPFLRDDARMALSNTLGYKIAQKMTAHEEEEILFEILTASAREKLIFTYQRSGDDGSVVGPSVFLRPEWRDLAVAVPRSHREKLSVAKPAALSRRNLVSACLLSGEKPAALALADGEREVLPLNVRLEVQEALQSFDSGPYDGTVGDQAASRLSATDLETFGHCPFQYFVTRVLGIDPKEETKTPDEVAPRLRGSLVHLFFERFFREATKEGSAPAPEKIPEKLFERIFADVFNDEAEKEAGVWPIIWQSFLVAIKKQIREILEADLDDLAADSFRPVYFETRISARLPAPLDGIEWVGKVDRIDLSADAARIIDYKSGRKPKETVLSKSLKGFNLQPSLYLLLCEQFLKENQKPLASASFVYRYLKSPEMPEQLSWKDWQEYQASLFETVRVQLAALRAGRYPIIPSSKSEKYCDWCGLTIVCRRSDSLSVYRARKGAGDLINLREKRK